jgi:hypothetical protein
VRFYTARTNLWRGDIWGESMIWKAGKYASDLKKRNNGREIVASWDVAWTEGNKACPVACSRPSGPFFRRQLRLPSVCVTWS